MRLVPQAQAVAKHGPSLEEFVREKNGRDQPSKFRFMFGAGELGLPEHEEIVADAERDYFYERVVRSSSPASWMSSITNLTLRSQCV